MTAIALALGVFAAWCLIGCALLAVVRADTTELRVVLTAPALGASLTVVPLFVLSDAGMSTERSSIPVAVVLLVGSIVVLAWRRPRLPKAVAPVLLICIGALLLAGWPMFTFGFNWIANVNDDMANYVLSATQLVHHGLFAPLDAEALSRDRDYSTATAVFHSTGVRPGADITLATLTSLAKRPAYQVFMPLILALNLCGVCAAGALAMQAARRWWAAVVAAAFIAVSPLATYGVLQQLLPQVWGLGIAAALFALLMRSELHRGDGPRVGDVLLIGLLATAVVLVYVELAATLLLAYAVYVAVLALRRELELRPLVRLWVPPVAIVTVLLNSYLMREIVFVRGQASSGVTGSGSGSIFGYSLVPSALPAILGLDTLSATGTTQVQVEILVSVVVLGAVLVASVLTLRRGLGAVAVLVAYGALGVLLGAKTSDFGLFKLYMYVQPFLAAAAAIWLSQIRRRSLLAAAGIALLVLGVAQLRTQQRYVSESRNPVDLRHASAPDLLPVFRSVAASAIVPVVAATDHPTLGKLEAVSAGSRPIYFVSRDLFSPFVSLFSNLQSPALTREVALYRSLDPWKKRSFNLHATGSRAGVNTFLDNTDASAVLSSGRCRVILPTGSQEPINRRALPEGSPPVTARTCRGGENLLMFTQSALGQNFYGFGSRARVSFYQLERDYFFSRHTMAGLGRYVLFRVLNPTPRVRLVVSLTTTLRHDADNVLPPAAAVGASRARLPFVGRGSGRVFSPPLRAQTIAGQPYVLLDVGVAGRLTPVPRHGLESLYGKSVVLDPRLLTAYLRDISLVSDAQYRRLRAPSALRRFPADLSNPGLEYSGFYEDGWVAERSYAVLAGGHSGDLVIRADDVLQPAAKRLRVLVNGRTVLSRSVLPGALDLRVPIAASRGRRRIEIEWAASTPLKAPDLRPVSAHMSFIGVLPRTSK
jgi:hypothetical protein